MMQRLGILFIFLFLGASLHAQQRATFLIDSLEQVLEKAVLTDSQRVENLNELAFLLRNTHIEKAAAYAYRATQLARKIGFDKGLARSLGYEGMMAYRQGKYDFAVSYHLESLSVATSIADSITMAYRYNDLSNVYADMGELDRALDHTLRSLHIKEKINDLEGIATSWRNLGIIHLRKKQYPQALLHLEQAKRLATEIGDTRILAYTCIYLGEWHSQQQKPIQALGFLQGLVRIAVQDMGKGISAQQKSSLFNEKHFSLIGTAGEAGPGLGLYLVKTLTEQNQGSVWVESEEGQGSTFYIELPTQPYGQLSLEKA